MRIGMAAAVALILAAPAVAQKTPDAAMLTARDPQRIADLLREMGFRATVNRGSDGNPEIETSMAGRTVRIFFLTCTNGRDCEDVQFFVGIATTRKLTPDQVNRFNADRRFVRLYLDKDRDPLMEYDLSMIGPGISVAVFRDTVAVWERQIGNLGRLIDEAK